MVYSDIYLDFQDPGSIKIIKVSQNDSGQRRFRFHMLDGSNDWTIPNDCTVTMSGTKPDKNGFVYECSFVGSEVYKTCEEQMTAVEGYVRCKLAFVDTYTNKISTFLFFLLVEKDAIDSGTVFSDSDLAYAQTIINELQNIGAYANALHKKLEFEKYEDETIVLKDG